MPFDPNFHEAVEITTDPDVEIDTVTKVYQRDLSLMNM
jgi:molecular chaperone GrpE (heat shock protein)